MNGQYTLARKITYINFCFERNSPQITLQLHKNSFLEFISRNLHFAYSFVIQKITCKNCLGMIFLRTRTSVTLKNAFIINSGVAGVRLADQNGPLQAKMDKNEPFWSILVSQMLKSSSGPFWSILLEEKKQHKHKLFGPDTRRENPRERAVFLDPKSLC